MMTRLDELEKRVHANDLGKETKELVTEYCRDLEADFAKARHKKETSVLSWLENHRTFAISLLKHIDEDKHWRAATDVANLKDHINTIEKLASVVEKDHHLVNEATKICSIAQKYA
jgi:hypothetical protein